MCWTCLERLRQRLGSHWKKTSPTATMKAMAIFRLDLCPRHPTHHCMAHHELAPGPFVLSPVRRRACLLFPIPLCVKLGQQVTQKQGVRVSAYRAFLHPIMDRPNLKVCVLSSIVAVGPSDMVPLCTRVRVCVFVCVCVCVSLSLSLCLCVCARERERDERYHSPCGSHLQASKQTLSHQPPLLHAHTLTHSLVST